MSIDEFASVTWYLLTLNVSVQYGTLLLKISTARCNKALKYKNKDVETKMNIE
jgi:hypothetical protein